MLCRIFELKVVLDCVEREIMEGTNRPEDKSLTKGKPRKPTYVEVASRKQVEDGNR